MLFPFLASRRPPGGRRRYVRGLLARGRLLRSRLNPSQRWLIVLAGFRKQDAFRVFLHNSFADSQIFIYLV
jgi:hypothetical protein